MQSLVNVCRLINQPFLNACPFSWDSIQPIDTFMIHWNITDSSTRVWWLKWPPGAILFIFVCAPFFSPSSSSVGYWLKQFDMWLGFDLYLKLSFSLQSTTVSQVKSCHIWVTKQRGQFERNWSGFDLASFNAGAWWTDKRIYDRLILNLITLLTW